MDQIEKRTPLFSVANSRNLVFSVANSQAEIGGFGADRAAGDADGPD